MTRPDHPLRRALRRDIDLPPSIVWSALLDTELLAGWLGDAVLTDGPTGTAVPSGVEEGAEPEIGFVLTWPNGTVPQVRGRVVDLVEAERLVLETTTAGRVAVVLEERTGGLRGSWTALLVEVEASAVSAGAVELALDRLEQVLHGHPVDWAQNPPLTELRGAL